MSETNSVEEKKHDFMDEALASIASCWWQDDTGNHAMEPTVAERAAKIVANWMDESARAHSNSSFWRGLLMQCAAALPMPYHKISYTQDDGNVVPEPLGLKAPEAVQKLAEDYTKLRTAMLALVGCEENELEQMVVILRLLIANNVAPSSDIVPSINAVEALIETRGS